MNKNFLLSGFLVFPFILKAQESDTIPEGQLQEVIIKAFEHNRRLKDVPAAVNYLSSSNINRFSPTSIVQAVNTTPGIKMEERSPGSYRINIRGSSLRSPFGVRNIKVYFNDIPITDPGGHTYFNQLGFYNFNSLEIIKGPGNSLYGAGTGGVLLAESMNVNEKPSIQTSYTTGSYHLQNSYAAIINGSDSWKSLINLQHQKNAGYRDHSQLQRTVAGWTGRFLLSEKHILQTTFLYGHLFYETPGALTYAEYNATPKKARPGNATFPSAESARASISQKMFLAGASYAQTLSHKWINKTVVYGMFTELRNPNIRNYDKSSEPHFGGRTSFKFNQAVKSSFIQLVIGSEWQQGFTSVSIFKNVSGTPDSLRTTDEINNRQASIFTQAVWDHLHWNISAGASLNLLRVHFQRFTPATTGAQQRDFTNQIAPRVALLKKMNRLNIYTSIAKGFSPPATAELVPTGGAVNFDLQPEKGINYDVGIKGSLFKNIYIDINAFIFSLQNTIVQRRTAGGGDFFVNAGNTKQYGIESFFSSPIFLLKQSLAKSNFWFSHTWHHFRYKNFKQINSDFSGNKLPGVAPHIISSGIDIFENSGWSGNASYYFSGKLPLNDANNEYAAAYHLVAIKMGYEKNLAQWKIKVMAGADNLLNQKFSLGNDINGFGGRYYNAAPGRNFYLSVSLQSMFKNSK